MASVPTYQSNPYANFSPDQWQNPYSLYQNEALPWPSLYDRWPTDASGNPIQPQPGMTLNSMPSVAPAAPAGPNAADLAARLADVNRQIAQANMMPQMSWGNNQMGNFQGTNLGELAQQRMALQRQIKQAQAAAPAQPQAAAGGGGPLTVGSPLTAQQYLQLRANPGRITTPGATVPQSASAQPGPGVLQAFLQNWNPAQSGPGSGFQQGFANALRGMGY